MFSFCDFDRKIRMNLGRIVTFFIIVDIDKKKSLYTVNKNFEFELPK
jgi:hypothetical protein